MFAARSIGHRGCAAHAPENTLAGLREAAKRGITWVEIDVCLLRDATRRTGVKLSWHDPAASLAEVGYSVKVITFHDSPRRAHSIAAQGGINAAKNYKNDGDSVMRLFYDTVKGGDYRAREANVYRLAQISVNIIDQCVAQGVPFAREYVGLLANRSFGGAQVSRTFYARGQTGQQLLLGAYQSMMRQVDAGTVKLFPRREMLDLVVVDGKAQQRKVTIGRRQPGRVEITSGLAAGERSLSSAITSRPLPSSSRMSTTAKAGAFCRMRSRPSATECPLRTSKPRCSMARSVASSRGVFATKRRPSLSRPMTIPIR